MNTFSLTKQDTMVMKGIAVLAMLIHHVYGCSPAWVMPYTGVLHWIGELGKVCVALFLFCSGYGLAKQYSLLMQKDNIKIKILDNIRFITKRLVKFYVNYWVIFLIFVPVTVLVFNRPLSVAYGEHVNTYKHLLYDILGLHGHHSYNITWWFNTLIIMLYLLFPIIYDIAKKLPIISIFGGLFLLRYAYEMPFNPEDILIWQFPFLLGIMYVQNEDRFSKFVERLSSHLWVVIILVISLLILSICLRMYPISAHWTDVRMDGFIALAIALCVISILRKFNSLMTILAFFGKHSINIYLIHTFFNGFWHLSWLHDCEWLRGGVNYVILLGMCLLTSMAIEFLKDKIGIYKLQQIITNRI